MMPITALVVLGFASYRATRVFTDDSLTEAWRDRLYRWAWDDDAGDIERRDGETVLIPQARAPWRTYVYELWTCKFCLGVWVSAVLYSLWRWVDVTPVRAIIVILAVAGAQAFIASRPDA